MSKATIPVFGCVRSIEGEDLTISVIGPTDEHPRGARILPGTGKRRSARIPVAALLHHWTLLDGVNARSFRGHTRLTRTETD
jgi:hypothetical protein